LENEAVRTSRLRMRLWAEENRWKQDQLTDSTLTTEE